MGGGGCHLGCIVGRVPGAPAAGKVLAVEGGGHGCHEEQVEAAEYEGRVVGRRGGADGRNCPPGDHGAPDRDASGQDHALEGQDDGRVLHLDPAELEGGPAADDKEERAADAEDEEAEQQRPGAVVDAAAADEEEVAGGQGDPHGRKGALALPEGVEHVGGYRSDHADSGHLRQRAQHSVSGAAQGGNLSDYVLPNAAVGREGGLLVLRRRGQQGKERVDPQTQAQGTGRGSAWLGVRTVVPPKPTMTAMAGTTAAATRAL